MALIMSALLLVAIPYSYVRDVEHQEAASEAKLSSLHGRLCSDSAARVIRSREDEANAALADSTHVLNGDQWDSVQVVLGAVARWRQICRSGTPL